MCDYPFFIPQVVLFANSSLFWFKVTNEHREFRNYLKFIQIIMSVHQIVDHGFEFLILYSHIHPHHFPWSPECIEKGKPVLSDTIKLLPLTSSASLRSSSVFCVHPHLSHPISPIIHLAHPSGQAAYHLRQRTVRLKFRMHHRSFPGSVL